MRASRQRVAFGLLAAAASSAAVAASSLLASAPARSAQAEPAGNFELLGSDPLRNRGMNSALAVHGRLAYVGNRADGTHPDAGILVVDVADPRKPKVIHEIGPPGAALPGESTRELRVWPDQELLVVLSFRCHQVAHLCSGSEASDAQPTVRFFDIRGEKASKPELVSTYELPANPHEFFLWDDPKRPGRALLYITTAYAGTGATIDKESPHLLVADISRAREDRFREFLRWSPERDPQWNEAGLHSLSISHDGRRAYLADLEGGFLMADTSDLARAEPNPQIRQVTPGQNAVHHEEPGAHSALPLPGRPYALVADEVYGRGFDAGPRIGFNMLKGCPWGWVRLIDVRNPAAPKIASEYKVAPWNTADRCEDVSMPEDQGASYSSHNPTVTPNLGLITWHSAGLRAVSLREPERPTETASFLPKPLDHVEREDPALSGGGTVKTIMWSYPVVQDGLIYVADIRNGLFILRYHGPHATELACRTLIEGNSNVGARVPACGLDLAQRQRCAGGRLKVAVTGQDAGRVTRMRSRRRGRRARTTVTLDDGTSIVLSRRARRCRRPA